MDFAPQGKQVRCGRASFGYKLQDCEETQGFVDHGANMTGGKSRVVSIERPLAGRCSTKDPMYVCLKCGLDARVASK